MTVVHLDIYPADDPLGTKLVTLTDEDVTFSMRDGENQLGSGSLTIRRDHASATEANLATGNYVTVTIPLIDSDPIFEFWLDQHTDTLVATGEEGAETLTREGPGGLSILGRARFLDDIWAPAPPASADRGSANEVPGYWRWEHKQYGQILKRFIEEGQNEPGLPLQDVTTDFDRTNDSDGTPWPAITRDVRFPIGTDGLELADAMAQTGEVFIHCTPGLLISARQARGVDRTSSSFGAGKVRLVKGVNIQTELVRQGDGDRNATHAIVIGEDATYEQVVSPSYVPGSPGRWVTVNYNVTNDSGVLGKVGAEDLRRGQAEQQAITLEYLAGDDEANGLYLPYRHFVPGDLITLHTGTDPWDYNEADERVMAITIALREASDDSTDELKARSLIFGIEIGGSAGGFGELSVTPDSLGDDPFFMETDVDFVGVAGNRGIRFRPAYAGVGASNGNDDDDAWWLTTVDGSGHSTFEAFVMNAAGRFADFIVAETGLEGDGDKIQFNLGVGGLSNDDDKFYVNDGWGIVMPVLAADPAGAASEEGQFYFNSVSKTIRWCDGTVWADVGSGGGGSFTPISVGFEADPIGATSPTPGTLTTIAWTDVYDQAFTSLGIGSVPAALGLSLSAGNTILTADEDGVWAIELIVDDVTDAPGSTGLVMLVVEGLWYNPQLVYAASGNQIRLPAQTRWVTDFVVPLKAGQTIKLEQRSAGSSVLLTDYAVLQITRLANTVS